MARNPIQNRNSSLGMTLISFYPQMALFRNLGVKLRVSLCDVLSYVSAQTLVFPRQKRGIFDLTLRKCHFWIGNS